MDQNDLTPLLAHTQTHMHTLSVMYIYLYVCFVNYSIETVNSCLVN